MSVNLPTDTALLRKVETLEAAQERFEQLKADLTAMAADLAAARDAAESANRAKSGFLANMSHEFRTPLTAILGYVGLILDGVYGPCADDIREVIGRIHDSATHLLALVNDVLDISKIEAQRMDLFPTEYSIYDLAHSVIADFESLALRRGLLIRASTADGAPIGYGDDRRIRQVLLNLVDNAVKFTPSGGQVSLDVTFDSENFVISVSDTGIGIRPEDQARIFGEFQRGESSLSRSYEGTGLGLPIARQLIELHGGKIAIDSAFETGTTVRVTLPIRANVGSESA